MRDRKTSLGQRYILSAKHKRVEIRHYRRESEKKKKNVREKKGYDILLWDQKGERDKKE